MLQFENAIERYDLLSPSIVVLLQQWPLSIPVENIKVAEIDPQHASGDVLCETYNIPHDQGANCVVVEATRGENRRLAACLIPVGCKMDLNKKVRKLLNARRVSLAPKDEVLAATEMEYGSVTALGLPNDWTILVDSRLITVPELIIGAGKVNAKLCVPGSIFTELENVQIVEELGFLS